MASVTREPQEAKPIEATSKGKMLEDERKCRVAVPPVRGAEQQ
jgi:hypothetical protein